MARWSSRHLEIPLSLLGLGRWTGKVQSGASDTAVESTHFQRATEALSRQSRFMMTLGRRRRVSSLGIEKVSRG